MIGAFQAGVLARVSVSSGPPAGTLLLLDSFTESSNTALTSHIPDTRPDGAMWERIRDFYSDGVGTGSTIVDATGDYAVTTFTGGNANQYTEQDHVIECSYHNAKVTCPTVTQQASSNTVSGLFLRSNGIYPGAGTDVVRAYLDRTNSRITLNEYINGSVLQTVNSSTVTIGGSTSYNLLATINGSDVVFELWNQTNTTKLADVSMTLQQPTTHTKFGVLQRCVTANAGTRHDTFRVESL